MQQLESIYFLLLRNILFAQEILNELNNNSCQLFSFVQESKYNNPEIKISRSETDPLAKIGKVEILVGRHDFVTRGDKFKSFIESNI